jgi:uncharacterized protein (TIGR03067 family)
MRFVPSLLFVLCLAWPGRSAQDPPSREQAGKEELQRLQGTWQCQSLEQDGEKAGEAGVKDRTLFFGAEGFVVKQGFKLVQAGNVKVDPTKRPKTLNAFVTQGEGKGEVMLGIYELTGDTLKLCLDLQGQKRPAEFKTTAGSGQVLAVYRRQRAPGADDLDITGTYDAVSVELDGSRHQAEVVIERRGDAYQVAYKKGNAVAYLGIGIRRRNTFSVCWANPGQVGIVVYEIQKDGKLVGQYTQLGGPGLLSQETLTRPKAGGQQADRRSP